MRSAPARARAGARGRMLAADAPRVHTEARAKAATSRSFAPTAMPGAVASANASTGGCRSAPTRAAVDAAPIATRVAPQPAGAALARRRGGALSTSRRATPRAAARSPTLRGRPASAGTSRAACRCCGGAVANDGRQARDPRRGPCARATPRRAHLVVPRCARTRRHRRRRGRRSADGSTSRDATANGADVGEVHEGRDDAEEVGVPAHFSFGSCAEGRCVRPLLVGCVRSARGRAGLRAMSLRRLNASGTPAKTTKRALSCVQRGKKPMRECCTARSS